MEKQQAQAAGTPQTVSRTLSVESLSILVNRLANLPGVGPEYQVKISTSTALAMLRESPLAYSEPMKIATDIIPNACAALYGVRPENVLPELCQAVVVWLEGKNLTIFDIQEAFRTTEVRKVPYVGISRDEILEPIRSYWQKKCALLHEIERAEKEQNERQAKANADRKWLTESLHVFHRSYKKGEWTGTEWQAATIRRMECFSEIDRRVCRLLWQQAKYEDKQRRFQMNNGIGGLLPTSSEYIFSQKWISYICSRQITITLFER